MNQITEEDLKALELRLEKRWVIRPDQIKALIVAVRTYRDTAGQAANEATSKPAPTPPSHPYPWGSIGQPASGGTP